jgi:LPXTG-motif cell wall-anchored protein
MKNLRRSILAAAVASLLVVGAMAPAVAQSSAEDATPYPEDSEEPEEPEEPDVGVQDEVVDADDDDSAVDVDDDAEEVAADAQTTEVLGISLARTGVNATLLALGGLMILAIGALLLRRTRRATTEGF